MKSEDKGASMKLVIIPIILVITTLTFFTCSESMKLPDIPLLSLDKKIDLAANQALAPVLSQLPLSTSGRYIVDAQKNRFKLKSVNWYGAHMEKEVVQGLDFQPIEHIVSLIKEWGFNSVRLPFSNVMLHDIRPVPNEYIAANPRFFGMTPIQVYDETVRALTDAGIVVVLNNHTTLSEWCCGYDFNGLWYHTGSGLAYNQTTEMWQADWLQIVNRYRNNPMVAAADLRNEVRTMRLNDTFIPESPNWGWGNQNDWHKAAQDVAGMINRSNPDILIIVEGINWWGLIPALGSGERPHLKPVRDLPVRLRVPDKIIYAAHNYSYIGPKHNGDDSTSAGNIKYREMDPATFRDTLYNEWGYVVDREQYYSSPVWVSEFGIARNDPTDQDREWFKRLVDVLIERDLDFAYWPLNSEGYGLVSPDWSSTQKDDWRYEHLSRLLAFDGATGPVKENRYTSVGIGGGDDNQSTMDADWLSGASKGTCPDGFRMTGLSRDYRALCTDADYGLLAGPGAPYSVQAVYETPDRSHNTGDWAGGFTKYECPTGYFAEGLTKHWWGTSGILCGKSARPLANGCRTLWFDRGDNRSSTRGGDFAGGSYKGQCGDGEYLAGIAQRDGGAAALLCCAMDRYAQMKNRAAGLCMDIAGGNMADGTAVILWGCHGGDNQKWSYSPETGLLRSKSDQSYCLDNGGRPWNNGTLQIRNCDGNINQQFDMDGDGTIRNRANRDAVLDGYGTWQGASVGSWADTGGNNQKWDPLYE